MSLPICIIGGGLAGLTAAYRLHQAGQPFFILEARDRLGGRILTEHLPDGASIELGATWLGGKHQSLTRLLSELEVGIFEQALGQHAWYEPMSLQPPQLVDLPPNEAPSYRIQGGSDALIQALAGQLPEGRIFLNQAVTSLERQADGVLVQTPTQSWEAAKVIVTAPPALFAKHISCTPDLSADFLQLASLTHTWMGESIKVGWNFPTPFWQETQQSGTIFSNVGPVSEMYDHSTHDEIGFALKGFLNGGLADASKAERKAMVRKQLSRYFGEEQLADGTYVEKIWRSEPFTFVDYEEFVLPHQHNGNPALRRVFWEGKLFFAGSETAAGHPGYMDGAVERGEEVVREVMGVTL
ncbi:MAG: NAD(P)/FAD-dependent oxidoreductase [Bacteroidota bacterium]